jgi:hypothetical protein
MAISGPPPTRSGRIPNRKFTSSTTPVGIEDKNVEAALRRISEVVERREGRLGDKSEAAVTWADLQGIGMVKPVSSGGAGGFGYESLAGADSFNMFMCPAQGFSAPTNLRLFVNINTVLLDWDILKSCSVGAFEVWRGTTTNLNEARLLATVFGTGYADVNLPTPAAGKTVDYYYWVRSLSVEGTPSGYSQTTGVKATIHASLTDQMAAIDDKISKRLLDTGLTESINVIDGNAATVGTLAWHVRTLQEADAGNVNSVKQWIGYRTATTAERAKYGTTYVTASIEQGAKITEVEGKLNGIYQVRIDNGKVAGFQLVNNAGQPSSFDIWADRFSISSKGSNGRTVSPFRVTSDGRVWINEAIIDTATLGVARIQNGFINNAKITAAEIYGDAKINGEIHSGSYAANPRNGWKLFSDGSAYFGNNVTFAGKLDVASHDSTGRVTINSNGIRVFDAAGRMRIAIGKL